MPLLYKFVGDPMEREHDLPPSTNGIEWFGKSFRVGVPVDIADLTDAQKLAIKRNTHFEAVVDVASAEEVAVKTKAVSAVKAKAEEA